MSKLENLLKEFCPEGVEHRKLGAICHIEKGKTPIQKATPGEFPLVVTADERFWCDSYQFDCNAVCIPLISSSGHGKKDLRTIHYQSGKFALGNILCAVIPRDESYVSAQFLYIYLLAKKDFLIVPLMRGGANVSLSTDSLKNIKVPVPPLEVQQEIVRILDQFTQLTAELTAELTARKKQYHYYRSKLLAQQTNVQKVSLRSVVKHSCSGATPAKSNSDYYEGGTIPWLRTQDVRFNEIYSVDSFITEKAVEETAAKWIPENCVIVAISGATAGRCAINKIKTTTNQHCLNLEIDAEKALYKYVYYCVCNQHEELLSKKQGARGDLNSSLILGMQIPLPPLPKQRRIVAILDRFDALCNDLTIGLPAEIAARQKQYEYYRDKLLTFPERKN